MLVEIFSQLLNKIHHIADLTETDKDTIIGLAEKYVMICCYRNLFCPATTTDEEKDLELQNRIRRLNWISTKELNCAINERSQVERCLVSFESASSNTFAPRLFETSCTSP